MASLASDPSNPSSSVPLSQSSSPDAQSSTSIVALTLPIHTKLSRSNFLAWKSQIEPLLHAYGLIQFITSSPLSPTTTDVTTGQISFTPNYSSWHRQDQMILAWLHASLSEPILAQVVSCSSSFDLWRSLTQTFSASSRARLTELKKKLQTIVKGGLSCTEFL